MRGPGVRTAACCEDGRVTDGHPELNEYEPGNGKPLRSKHTLRAMRVVVVLAILGLVLPGVVSTLSVASATAQSACETWVAYEVDGASGVEVRFEAFGPGGLGWECYSDGAFGGDRHIVSLGLIPGTPELPSGVPRDS